MKVLVSAPLNPYSGYGNDGIGIIRALVQRGIDVYVKPTHVSPPLPKDVAALLTKRLEAPFDLLIHHVDPDQLGISPEMRRAAKITVAHTMWEYTTLDNAKGRRSLRKRLANYDVVFGYDSVSAGALEPYTLTRGRQGPALGILQGGFWPQQWPQVQRDWTGDRFGFAMVGALNQRKDPFVAIEAFRELKAEYPEEFDGAELHLKGQPLDAPVLTQSGWVRIGDLQVGDLIVDPLGGFQKVDGIQDLGERDIYRVTLRDGSSVECTWDHLWQVKLAEGPWRVMSTEQLVSEDLRRGSHLRWEVPLVVAPDLEGGDRPLDPYLLGLLLGDGHLQAVPAFGSADPELIEAVRGRLPAGVEMVHRETRGKYSWFGLVGIEHRSAALPCVGHGPHILSVKRSRGLCPTCYLRERRAGTLAAWELMGGPVQRRNVIGAALEVLGLSGRRAWDKFVPESYKFAPAEVRLEVLRGLMDSDGTAPRPKAGPSFTSCSRELAEDVRWLVRSLGGTASITVVRPTYPYRGELRTGREAYQVKVSLSVNPFRLRRKASQWDAVQASRRHVLRHRIVSIDKIGRAEARCILVSGVEGLYVTSDFVVTHNTNVPGLHMAMEQWVPKLRVHYDVWPDDVLAEFYAAQHCLLAPSRGEGKNMPALEFMSTGGTVIATNWGGQTQWLSSQYAYPLDYQLAPVKPTLPDCRNARASKTHLKELMWHVYRNRDEARRKGDLAAQLVPAMCSWPAVIDRLFLKLSELAPGGEHLLNAARQSAETGRPRSHADA